MENQTIKNENFENIKNKEKIIDNKNLYNKVIIENKINKNKNKEIIDNNKENPNKKKDEKIDIKENNEKTENLKNKIHDSYIEKMGIAYNKEFSILQNKFDKENEEQKLKIKKLVFNKSVNDLEKREEKLQKALQ